ncbi:hypothetical protein BC828DRAFT_432010 [Blastocladiella britannica]|nr:hypothetical protein BC828DRAFT_432010 [Blastocladiella britannica]
MSHVCNSSSPGIAELGAELLLGVPEKHVPINDVLDHRVVTSGLVQALCVATASSRTNIQMLWQVAELFIQTRPQYLDTITSSDFLQTIVTGCHDLTSQYDVTGAVTAVSSVCNLGYGNEATTDTTKLDCVKAAVALCQRSGPEDSMVIDMMVQLTSDPPSVVTNLLVEQMDVPAVLARGATSPDHDHDPQLRSFALLQLLELAYVAKYHSNDSPDLFA